MRETDTIYALSSGALPSGVAVVRVSGPGAGMCVKALTGAGLPLPRRAVLRALRGPDGDIIDRALVLWLPGPASFTGEDMAEFHVHGGRAVVAALVDALAALPAVRPAEPGAFTRRAFAHGRMDLTAAEALADLIAADTDAQRIQALRQAGGALAALYDGWRTMLIGQMALVEAAIDFSDEDLPDDLLAPVHEAVGDLVGAIKAHLADGHRGERLRDGLRVAVLGPPNAGKSSIINYLAKRDVAIVSPQAGTTRDLIEVHLDLGGLPVTVIDTAGLRETAELIEAEGVRRARNAAAAADFKLLVYDLGAGPAPADLLALRDDRSWIIANKTDVAPAVAPADHWPVSAQTGAGFDALIAALAGRLGTDYAPGEAPLLTRARHRQALEEAADALGRARDMLETDSVLAAEDLRLAARALGRITGRVDVEDVLDRIFADFCIGK